MSPKKYKENIASLEKMYLVWIEEQLIMMPKVHHARVKKKEQYNLIRTGQP